MGPVDNQLQRLKERIADAHWTVVHGSGMLVVLPSFQLPGGWNKAATEVQFLAPQGYPYARPDCFWADGDLRLAARPGLLPQSTQLNNPGLPQLSSKLWFSWHLLQWDPNRDDLLTWVACIRARFLKLN